jgi:hypothetical protein
MIHHDNLTEAAPRSAPLQALAETIQHATHLLPAQGPISVFIHHNTLHAFEDLPFDQAVRRGKEVFGCEPYLHEARYRDELARGRITPADLEAVLREENHVDHPVAGLCSRYELRLAMLGHPLQAATDVELNWWLVDTRGLERFRDDAAPGAREHFVGWTRAWVETNLASNDERLRDTLQGVKREDPSLKGDPSSWRADKWEPFTLRLLWHLCRDALARVKR